MSAAPADGALRDEDYQRLLAFRSGLREFLHWSAEAARHAGLTPSLHQLLLVVRGSAEPSGPTIGQAAAQLHVRHHSTVELAQRAEAAGLLRRERDPADRRRVRLLLTGAGAEQLDALTAAHLPRIEVLARTLEGVLRP